METGQILYGTDCQILNYKVIKAIENQIYEIECLECNHGGNCRMFVKREETNGYRFLTMTNNIHESYHVGSLFFLTEKEARNYRAKKEIKRINEEIAELLEEIKALKIELEE